MLDTVASVLRQRVGGHARVGADAADRRSCPVGTPGACPRCCPRCTGSRAAARCGLTLNCWTNAGYAVPSRTDTIARPPTAITGRLHCRTRMFTKNRIAQIDRHDREEVERRQLRLHLGVGRALDDPARRRQQVEPAQPVAPRLHQHDRGRAAPTGARARRASPCRRTPAPAAGSRPTASARSRRAASPRRATRTATPAGTAATAARTRRTPGRGRTAARSNRTTIRTRSATTGTPAIAAVTPMPTMSASAAAPSGSSHRRYGSETLREPARAASCSGARIMVVGVSQRTITRFTYSSAKNSRPEDQAEQCLRPQHRPEDAREVDLAEPQHVDVEARQHRESMNRRMRMPTTMIGHRRVFAGMLTRRIISVLVPSGAADVLRWPA